MDENKESFYGFDLGKKEAPSIIMYCWRPKEIERCNGTSCQYMHEWIINGKEVTE